MRGLGKPFGHRLCSKCMRLAGLLLPELHMASILIGFPSCVQVISNSLGEEGLSYLLFKAQSSGSFLDPFISYLINYFLLESKTA